MSEHILVEKKGNVQIIRLNRPEKKNALTNEMYHALTDAFIAGDKDDEIRVHVLTGTQGVFTAGNDISDFFQRATSEVQDENPGVQRFLFGQFERSKPVIAAVDGLAVGVGTTLLFHCDLVYASERAQFLTPFAALGLTPENASSVMFPKVMGYQRAFEMLCLGETFSAAKAKEAGFVNEVVAPEKLEEHVLEVAARLAAKPKGAILKSRQLLRSGFEDLTAVIRHENGIFGECLKSEDAKNALKAFLTRK